MAATVVDASEGSVKRTHHAGVNPVDHTATIATTSLDEAGDDVLLVKFPPGAMLDVYSLVCDFSDMDTGGTPALVSDIGVCDSDGVIDTVLINDSAAGQTGAVDDADTPAARWVDVGDKYLGHTVVTAAATEAAGTIRVWCDWRYDFPTTTGS